MVDMNHDISLLWELGVQENSWLSASHAHTKGAQVAPLGRSRTFVFRYLLSDIPPTSRPGLETRMINVTISLRRLVAPLAFHTSATRDPYQSGCSRYSNCHQ